jgi:ubiquinone biosynthesis protein UbiJ
MARIVKGKRSEKPNKGSSKEGKRARKAVSSGLAHDDIKDSKNAAVKKLAEVIGELIRTVDSLDKRIDQLDKGKRE